MARVLVPLAQGCEELEAVTIIDLLRRAEIDVVSAGLTDEPVRASRGTVLLPDAALADVLDQEFDLVVLPGGLPGADHLAQDARIIALLHRMAAQDRYIAAICAAPRVLARAGLLEGRRATCFPGALNAEQQAGATMVSDAVVVDGKLITSKGPGTAMDFALILIEALVGRARRDQVEAALQRVA